MSETTIFVTVHQLSERTGLPVSFLNTEAEAGRMPTKKIGRRTFFDVEAAVRTLTDPNAIERLTAERDEARRLVIEADWCKDPSAKWPDLWAARGWPVPGPETTTLTCPYCDYREVVHAKPSPSDHAMCASCAMEHSE
jgi:hypothetical protein